MLFGDSKVCCKCTCEMAFVSKRSTYLDMVVINKFISRWVWWCIYTSELCALLLNIRNKVSYSVLLCVFYLTSWKSVKKRVFIAVLNLIEKQGFYIKNRKNVPGEC